MSGISLEFEINHEGRNFLVSYDSESTLRNVLMSIQFDNLPIDTGELQNYDAKLYETIKGAMKNNAESFWREEEANQKSSYGNVIGGHFFNALKNAL